MKPIIVFEGYSIKKLLVESIDQEDLQKRLRDDEHLNISVKQGVSEDRLNAGVMVNAILYSAENSKKYDITVEGFFSIGEEYSVKPLEEIENILRVNGTALVYPYIRSTLSVISSLDSPTAVVLPTLNTQIFSDK